MKCVGSYPGAWHVGAFPGGSMPPSPLVLPLPLAATHLHIPHPPGAVVFTMLLGLTQVEPLQLEQGRTWVNRHILFAHVVHSGWHSSFGQVSFHLDGPSGGSGCQAGIGPSAFSRAFQSRLTLAVCQRLVMSS